MSSNNCPIIYFDPSGGQIPVREWSMGADGLVVQFEISAPVTVVSFAERRHIVAVTAPDVVGPGAVVTHRDLRDDFGQTFQVGGRDD